MLIGSLQANTVFGTHPKAHGKCIFVCPIPHGGIRSSMYIPPQTTAHTICDPDKDVEKMASLSVEAKMGSADNDQTPPPFKECGWADHILAEGWYMT